MSINVVSPLLIVEQVYVKEGAPLQGMMGLMVVILSVRDLSCFEAAFLVQEMFFYNVFLSHSL